MNRNILIVWIVFLVMDDISCETCGCVNDGMCVPRIDSAAPEFEEDAYFPEEDVIKRIKLIYRWKVR